MADRFRGRADSGWHHYCLRARGSRPLVGISLLHDGGSYPGYRPSDVSSVENPQRLRKRLQQTTECLFQTRIAGGRSRRRRSGRMSLSGGTRYFGRTRSNCAPCENGGMKHRAPHKTHKGAGWALWLLMYSRPCFAAGPQENGRSPEQRPPAIRENLEFISSCPGSCRRQASPRPSGRTSWNSNQLDCRSRSCWG